MTARISTLIDKVDSDHLVRDQIAAILKVESANQVALAQAASKPAPNEWSLRVYTERTQVWQVYQGSPENGSDDAAPIVNISLASEEVSKQASTMFSQKRYDGVFTVDVYGYGHSETKVNGHLSGDVQAARVRDRAKRLVRNILEHSTYDALRLDCVADRWVQSIEYEHPDFAAKTDWRAVQYVKMARLIVGVSFDEYSLQKQGEAFELLVDLVEKTESGEFVLAQLDFTPQP